MKKAYNSKRKSLFFLGLLCICLIFLTNSCGLDVLEAVLDDPFTTEFVPNESSAYDSRTFTFYMKKLDNANVFGKGYVYYKIYNNSSKRTTEKNTLDNMAADSSRKLNAYTTLINSYSYKPLRYVTALGGQPEEFTMDNESQTVSIRLTNYSTDAYAARIMIDNQTVGIPLRYNGKTFDFGRTGDYDEKPAKVSSAEESSSDVKGFVDDSNSNNTFYVVLYGIFYMPTETFDKTIYSPIHYLGEIKIDATSEIN